MAAGDTRVSGRIIWSIMHSCGWHGIAFLTLKHIFIVPRFDNDDVHHFVDEGPLGSS